MVFWLIFLAIYSVLASVAVGLLVWYSRKLHKMCYFASEAASEIFAHFAAYRDHLKSIFALEMFYGDRNLKEVIDHTKGLIEFLKRYDKVYSFTQPDLEEILEENETMEEENEQKQEVKKREQRKDIAERKNIKIIGTNS